MGSGLPHSMTRRELLTATAVGGGAVLAGGAGSLVQAKSPFRGLHEDAPWFEATILELQALMASGQIQQSRADQGLPVTDREAQPVAARNTCPLEGQYRYRRLDADDGRLVGAGRQPGTA